MRVLIINAGSSSLKYQLINMRDESVLAKGNVERIGIPGSLLKHAPQDKDTVEIVRDFNNHIDAVRVVIDSLIHKDYGVIDSMDEIIAVGHRVVHGGEQFSGSVAIDEDVMQVIKANSELAPLHNPANIMGIEACRDVMPNTPMVAVFDTAFHQTMPQKAYMYAIPYDIYARLGVRRYGFHGTSHQFVALKAASMLNKPIEELKIITCHLGNGSSIAAVDGGESVDTSMGFTPLEGLPMGTRSGSVDPAILNYIMEKDDKTCEEVNGMLNQKSGMLGLSGISSDFRDLHKAAAVGNERAKLALDVFNYEVKKYIGAYAAAMGGVDAIVFTAGIGENTSKVRAEACKGLEFLGVEIDKERNEKGLRDNGGQGEINTDSSRVKVLVIPTDEELMIARETLGHI